MNAISLISILVGSVGLSLTAFADHTSFLGRVSKAPWNNRLEAFAGEGNPGIQVVSNGKEPKSKNKAGAGQTAEGTFLRIDEGDYSHWVMKNSKGKEVSYFVLKPDASLEKVLANPKKFAGKQCRVQWKSTTENIPEAGGRMKVEQVLAVEWLGGK